MATLRDIKALVAEIEAAGPLEISKTQLLEALESLSDVQGILNTSNAPRDPVDPGAMNHTFSGAWEIAAIFERSRDTKGVQEQPTPGTPPFDGYRIRAGGQGNWSAIGRLKAQCDTAGTVRIRMAIIETDGTTVNSEPYRDQQENVSSGSEFDLSFDGFTKGIGGKDGLVTDEKIVMQVRGPAGGVLTVHEAHLHCRRG